MSTDSITVHEVKNQSHSQMRQDGNLRGRIGTTSSINIRSFYCTGPMSEERTIAILHDKQHSIRTHHYLHKKV